MRAAGIRAGFEAAGVVRLPGAFAAERAAAMREAVWRHAERQAGVRSDDPASWAGSPVLNWQGLKRDPVFGPLAGNPAVRDALDAIFGTGGWRRFRQQDPWLARLLDGAGLPGQGRPLVGTAGEIGGVPVEVAELTGSPGDVVITHLHVFHTRSPDTSPVPRLMLGKEIHRADEL